MSTYGGNQGYGGGQGYGRMQQPRMMQARGDPVSWDNPMSGGTDNFGQPQAPQPFSAGGGYGGGGAYGGGDRVNEAAQTGGYGPVSGALAGNLGGLRSAMGQPQQPQQSPMAMQMQNIGGYGTQPGGNSPQMSQPYNESGPQAPNMMQSQMKSIGGYQVQPMTQVPSPGNAPRPYQDPQTGPMPQGSPLPMAPQQTPPWAAQNPMMWQMLNGGANPQWQQFNDARYNQYQSNPWMK